MESRGATSTHFTPLPRTAPAYALGSRRQAGPAQRIPAPAVERCRPQRHLLHGPASIRGTSRAGADPQWQPGAASPHLDAEYTALWDTVYEVARITFSSDAKRHEPDQRRPPTVGKNDALTPDWPFRNQAVGFATSISAGGCTRVVSVDHRLVNATGAHHYNPICPPGTDGSNRLRT